MLTGSQAIVEMLKAHQVQVVFGLPGDTGTALYEALYEAREQIKHVMARDERSAAFMADVYARVSQRPGVCEGPSGGGATYIAPGVAEAHYSSIALIVLTTDIPLRNEGRNVLTEMDQEAFFASITKWSATVKRADKIPEIMRRAFRLATGGRPGAVHLCFPKDVLDEPGPAPQAVYADPACVVYPSYRTRADPQAVAQAVERLLQARRPLLIAGGGAVTSGAWPEITELAELLPIPVGTSINGKGSIAEDHPLSIGVVGENGGRPYANQMVREADLIFFVGCKTDSVTTMHWTLPPPDTYQTILQLDVDPREIGNNYRVAVGLAGDAKLTLQDVIAGICQRRGPSPAARARAEEIASRGSVWWKEMAASAASERVPIRSERIIQALQEALPPDYIIVADPGTMTPYTAAYFRSSAGRRVVIPRAFGGLGYAIPGVVGAYMARPGAAIVGLVGDGSFGMCAGELETIRRLNVPAVLIHFNNRCFGWIKTLQHFYHGAKYYSVDFCDVDHVAVARGFGLRAQRIERADQLELALREALASKEPTFLDVPTAPEFVDVPPVAKWQEAAMRERYRGDLHG